MALTKVNSAGIKDDAIVNADIKSDAAIAGSKLVAATSSVPGSMSASDKTKLDAIDVSADVTDATTVNAAGAIMHSDLGTKGQIVVGDGSGDATILSVGSNDQVLTADSSEASGVKWAAASGGAALTGSTNNTITTVTGADAIQGEANLTFDGGTLQQAIDANDEGYTILADGNHRPTIVGDRDAAGEHDELLHLVGKWNNTQVGAIDIQAGGDTSNKDDGHIIFYTSPASGSLNNRMKIHNDGQVSITDGDLVIGTSGHGISFAATGQHSGNTQELLDDYEEGTWTPDLYHQGAENKSGFYTKIGRIVFASFKLQALAAVGNANHQSIASLPFTVKNSNPYGGCARGWQNYASDLGPLYEPSGNSTQCYLYTQNGTNLAAQTLGTTQLSGVIIYITDS